MTAKQQALYALMEERGYSYGLIQTVVNILGQSKEALDDMMLFIADGHPDESRVVEHMASLCLPS